MTREKAVEILEGLAVPVLAEEAYDMAIEALKQPERKKGKWIEMYDAYNLISGRCSVCNWEAHLYEDDVFGMPYCPNCGADMRGEHDG